MELRQTSIVPPMISDDDEYDINIRNWLPNAQVMVGTIIEGLKLEREARRKEYNEQQDKIVKLESKLESAQIDILNYKTELVEWQKWKVNAEQVVENCKKKYQELATSWNDNVAVFESKLEESRAELQRVTVESRNKDYAIEALEIEVASLKRRLQLAQSVVI